MILKYVLSMGLCCAAVKAASQSDSTGVYRTAIDFASGKLSFAAHCKERQHGINLNSLLNKPYITITRQGVKQKLYKSEIYGYRDCDKRIYRFFENTNYQILNTTNIFLYSLEVLASDTKGNSSEIKYFFSTTSAQPILKLTKSQLKKTYPDNHKFHDLLDTRFTTDEDLIAYDKFQKKYVLVHLLAESQDK